jgi:hypothetical protein
MNTPLEALKSEIKNRALIYCEIYRRLSTLHGPTEAARLLGEAIHERGRAKGLELAARIGEPDLARLAGAFVEGKDGMDAFGHEVVEVSDTHVVLRLNRCPLVDAWDEAGLSPQEKASMCDIACQVDFGKFEAAGYALTFQCRIACGAPTCDMRVTRASGGRERHT